VRPTRKAHPVLTPTPSSLQANLSALQRLPPRIDTTCNAIRLVFNGLHAPYLALADKGKPALARPPSHNKRNLLL
jgi:hypothetical protein